MQARVVERPTLAVPAFGLRVSSRDGVSHRVSERKATSDATRERRGEPANPAKKPGARSRIAPAHRLLCGGAMKTSHFVTTFAALAAILGVHCSSSVDPQPEATQQSSAALCGNGVHPGCGLCYPDSSSKTGGIQTCFLCDGESYERDCTVTCGVWGAPCCAAPTPCFDSEMQCIDSQCIPVIYFDKTKNASR
jgi:hypothetical protein